MPCKLIISVEVKGERRDLHSVEMPAVPLDVAVDPESRRLAERCAAHAAAAAAIVAGGGEIIRA